jgi:hypothetical protein
LVFAEWAGQVRCGRVRITVGGSRKVQGATIAVSTANDLAA